MNNYKARLRLKIYLAKCIPKKVIIKINLKADIDYGLDLLNLANKKRCSIWIIKIKADI